MVKKTLLICLIALTAWGTRLEGAAAERSLSVYAETGVYNKSYKDRVWINEYKSFPVSMTSVAIEYSSRDEEGYIMGYGLAMADISSGVAYNLDRKEYQPHSFVFLPYAFAGYDFEYAGIELGAGSLLYYTDFAPVLYLNKNGDQVIDTGPGMYLDRTRSRAFPNFNIRILPLRIFHIKLRLSRENFNPVDSLFNMALIIPQKKNRYELNASLSTNIQQLPVSNQKFLFLYSRLLGRYTLGASFGYLIYNEHGGSRADISILDYRNLSAGLLLSMKW